jgi:insulinase (Peptidase family M16)
MFQEVYEGFTSTTLPNGLTVYVQPRKVSWVYVGIVVHAGAKEDPPGRQGLAHLVEHLVSENIEGLPFPMLERRFQALGATAHFGMTSYLRTWYDFHLPAHEPAVREALTLVGTMLLQGRLTRKIEEEKTVILCEYHIDYPIPSLVPGRWGAAPGSLSSILVSARFTQRSVCLRNGCPVRSQTSRRSMTIITPRPI